MCFKFDGSKVQTYLLMRNPNVAVFIKTHRHIGHIVELILNFYVPYVPMCLVL